MRAGGSSPGFEDVYDGDFAEPPGEECRGDGAEELRALFPMPLDEEGNRIRPAMRDLAMVKRDDPRRGATQMVVSNTWRNRGNRTYKQRSLVSFMRAAFREHMAAGGLIYQHTLQVATATANAAALLKAEQRAWDAIRKQFTRSGDSEEDAPALYRWFSTVNEQGANRVMFSSGTAFDGQEPLDDPVAALLETLRDVRPLNGWTPLHQQLVGR